MIPVSEAASGSRRRIVHVPRRFTQNSWGGTETVVLESAREELRCGHDARILTTQALDGTPMETCDGVEVERHPYFYPFLGLSDSARERMDQKGGNLLSLPLFHALMTGPRPDLLHLHTGKRLGGIVRVASRLRGIPYVVTLHGGAFDVPGPETEALVAPGRGALEWGKAVGWALGSRRVLADAAAVICLGAAEAARVRENYPGVRVVYSPNGVDAGRFAHGDGRDFRLRHGIPLHAELILNVGRIDPQKNQLLAVEALAQLKQRRPRVHLVLMGPVTSTAYEAQIHARVAELGLSRSVHVLPPEAPSSPALADAYHAADVFALTSRHEPFGIVILEAWAAGRPVVATRVGGIPSFVRDGVDGLLVEPGNSTEVAESIHLLLDSSRRRAALGEAGRVRAQDEFSWRRRTAKMLELYEDVIV